MIYKMEIKENYNAFKGNSKLGIKIGVPKPKPLKSSTETKLQLQNYKQEDMTGNLIPYANSENMQ